MKYAGLFEQSGQAVGLTVMIFVGQNYGAVKFNRIREDVCKGLLLTVIKNLPIYVFHSNSQNEYIAVKITK